MRFLRLIRCLSWLSAILFAAACAAQVMQEPGSLPGRSLAREPIRQPAPPSPRPAGAPPAATANQGNPAPIPAGNPLASSPALPPSLRDKPAQPAKITLTGGLLTIQANNSSLSAILHQLASSGGMSIDGFRQDQRVFGLYGPGNPRDVLSELLQGAGYNFLMVGSTEQGTPKEIVLTTRTGGAVTGGSPQPEPEDQPEEDDNSDNSDNDNPPEPPPVESPAPPPGPANAQPNPNGRVKTPAEIIQELQRLRQQQQQNPQ